MAGSYRHVINDDGNLGSNRHVTSMLENGGDVFEAVEEMYGMIWFLAGQEGSEAKEAVESARRNYKEGLKIAKEVNSR